MMPLATLPARAAEFTDRLAELSIALGALVAVALLLDLLLRPLGRPHLRIVPWLFVLARPLLPLTVLAALGGWSGAGDALLPALTASASDGVVSIETSAPSTAMSEIASSAPTSVSLRAWLALVWAAGVITLATVGTARHLRRRHRWLAGAVVLDGSIPPHWQRAIERARAQLGLRRAPRIAFVPDLASPLVLGFLRPVVLIPARLVDTTLLDDAARTHILLHECAHLRRRDPWLGALSAAVGIAFWFHPLVWIARRRLGNLVELCADARVAAVLRDETPAYRSTLLRLAAQVHGVRPAALPPLGAIGLLNSRAAIITRLRALERSTGERGRPLATMTFTAILALTVVPMSRSAERAPGDLPPPEEVPALASIENPADLAAEIIASDPPGCLLGRYAAFAQLGTDTSDTSTDRKDP